ncbi:MAG: sugar ABC transporter substrate-binding protein [Fimbriimonadaceae bacterium]|nr:sugar ABC transporter substrate-binding protein [Fimbriimonadaceae bacterium]
MLRAITVAALALLVFRLVMPERAAPKHDASSPVEVEMCVWGMPFENDLYTKVYIPEFERQNPGIKVRFHHFEDYPNRVLLSYAGGISPDVIRENTAGNMPWIRRGLDLPLNKYIDGPDGIDRKDFIPILWDALQYDGETYGVPQDINILGLFYNKDLFDKAGMAYPDENWTWDDLSKAAEKLTKDTDGDGHPEIIGLNMGWNDATFQPFVFQAGGKIWSDDGEKVVIDSPEAAGALKFYKSLMHSYTLSQSSDQRGGLGPDKFFEAGKVALFIDGSWRTPSLKKNAPNLRFGVAPLPRGKYPMSVSGSCFWGISAQTKHPDEAWKLVKFLSSKEALIEYWRYLWVAPPARWSALRSPEFRDVTGAKGIIPGIDSQEEFDEKCGWIPTVLQNNWTTIKQSSQHSDVLGMFLREAVDRVLLQNADPMESLKDAARRANQQIAESKRVEKMRVGP